MICSHDFLILIVHYGIFSMKKTIEIERERERKRATGHHACRRWGGAPTQMFP